MRDISGLRIMTLVMWKMFALLDKSALQYRTQVRDASYECVMNERGERRGRDSSQLTVQTRVVITCPQSALFPTGVVGRRMTSLPHCSFHLLC